MIKTLLAAGLLTTSLTNLMASVAYADGKKYSTTYKKRGYDKHYGSRKRYDDDFETDHRKSLRPSIVVVNGGSRSNSSATANGNSVVIGSDLDATDDGPLNPVADITTTNSAQDEIAETRAALRAARGIAPQSKPYVVIAGSSSNGDRTSSTVYMPETYEAEIEGDNEGVGKVIYFDD